MTYTNLAPADSHQSYSSLKIVFVGGLFALSVVATVVQTEVTSTLYLHDGLKDPIFLMFVTHSAWWAMWPLQFVSIALYKAARRGYLHRLGYENPHGRPWRGLRRAFASSAKTQHRNVAHTAEYTAQKNHPSYVAEFPQSGFRSYRDFAHSFAFRHMALCTLGLSVLLNVSGSTWYIAMGLSAGADVTAIFNCSAFASYVFSIPLLHELFSWTKMGAVLASLSGVLLVAYGSSEEPDADEYPHRLLGNVVCAAGAVLYGLYQVVYKLKCCPPAGIVSARREATFSNFTMCLIGIGSCIVLTTALLVARLLGIYSMDIPPLSKSTLWAHLAVSASSNMVFCLCFLGLMSLTSPVFSSVSSLTAILFVGLVEWLFRGVDIGLLQLLGYLFIMGGFGLMTYSSWTEISHEDTEDELLDTDTESTVSRLSETEQSIQV